MRTRVAVVVLPAVCLLGGCDAPADSADLSPAALSGDRGDAVLQGYDVAFDFDAPVVPGDVVPRVASVGTARVHTTVVTSAGGELTWTPDRGRGWAVRTPAARAEGPVEAAAIVVWPDAESLADLEPRGRPVDLAVDFAADPPAASRPGDDGDNLVQWGRFGDPAQLKLQLDHGRPSCRVAGSRGEVLVAADHDVVPGHWYRLTCSVGAGEVRLTLADLEVEGQPDAWVQRADVGEIVFGRVPLSIGAKVGAGGRLDRGSVDQFNGIIDRVVLDVR